MLFQIFPKTETYGENYDAQATYNSADNAFQSLGPMNLIV